MIWFIYLNLGSQLRLPNLNDKWRTDHVFAVYVACNQEKSIWAQNKYYKNKGLRYKCNCMHLDRLFVTFRDNANISWSNNSRTVGLIFGFQSRRRPIIIRAANFWTFSKIIFETSAVQIQEPLKIFAHETEYACAHVMVYQKDIF